MADEVYDFNAKVTALVGEEYAELVPYYVESAKEKVCSRLFPLGNGTFEDIPSRYYTRVVDIAVYLVNKRGAEGEKQHIESGVSRTYEDADVPPSMLRGLIPMVGVPK